MGGAGAVTCYQHGPTLFAGHLEDLPEGGAAAVAAAVGCPAWEHGADPATFDGGPVAAAAAAAADLFADGVGLVERPPPPEITPF